MFLKRHYWGFLKVTFKLSFEKQSQDSKMGKENKCSLGSNPLLGMVKKVTEIQTGVADKAINTENCS